MAACPSCGRESESTSAFCRYCGSPLSQEAPRHEQRKTVTILVCDLVHSTGLAAGDPEAYRRIQARYFERMRRIVERHGGTVEAASEGPGKGSEFTVRLPLLVDNAG